jgi:hypothetical protein
LLNKYVHHHHHDHHFPSFPIISRFKNHHHNNHHQQKYHLPLSLPGDPLAIAPGASRYLSIEALPAVFEVPGHLGAWGGRCLKPPKKVQKRYDVIEKLTSLLLF